MEAYKAPTAESLTEMMLQRTQAKRDMLRESGQIIKREMLTLIEMIDRGEWERFEVLRGDIRASMDVERVSDTIKSEMRRRDMILTHAKYQLGGYQP